MDTVADFLTRVRNALHADQDEAVVPSSRMNIQLARVLQEEGYIVDYRVEREKRSGSGRPTESEFDWLHVTLKYTEDRDSVISGLRRISKPGRRLSASVGLAKTWKPSLTRRSISSGLPVRKSQRRGSAWYCSA